jgi:hypothetical protein
MGDGKDDTKNNAETTNDNVGNAQEGVATTHDGAGGDDDGLGALIRPSWENCDRRCQYELAQFQINTSHTVFNHDLVSSLNHRVVIVARV